VKNLYAPPHAAIIGVLHDCFLAFGRNEEDARCVEDECLKTSEDQMVSECFKLICQCAVFVTFKYSNFLNTYLFILLLLLLLLLL